MRRWRWLAIASILAAGAGGYWYYSATPTELPVAPIERTRSGVVDDGAGEQSEAPIEPLLVHGGSSGDETPPAALDAGPLPRVMLTPGIEQPPRPESSAGVVPTMPYADD